MKPLVSIVILNHNGKKFLENCVVSVLKSNHPNFELILVDNGSTDGSYDLMQDRFGELPNVKIIRSERNIGFAAGNNLGYKESRGDYVAFLNVDTKVEPHWLTEPTQLLDSGPEVAVVQCKLVSMDDSEKIDSLGAFLDTLGYVYTWGEWYSAHPAHTTRQPFYAEGAALIARRSAVESVLLDGAPFDPDYSFFYEDSDLCWRLRLRGFSTTLAPHSLVQHYRGYVTGGHPKAIFNSTKNHISTLIKNYAGRNLIQYLPVLLVLELLRTFIYVRNGSASARAKLAGILYCLTNFKLLWRKRIFVQSRIRTQPDKVVLEAMLKPNFSTLMRSTMVT